MATATTTTTATLIATTTTDVATPALLGLLWLASPALPVGGYSYSEGLEAAVDSGRVGDEASASDWLLQQLHVAHARGEAPLMVAAMRAWSAADTARVDALNAWVAQTRESAELRLQTEQTGRSLVAWLRNGSAAADPRIAQLDALRPAPAWPVAWALAAVLAGAAERDAALAFGFGWAENMVQAAIKAVPLGQAAAQRILARLAAALPNVANEVLRRADGGDFQAWTPALAILSARHEVQYSRLFRS